jgi:hypothetical protein
VPTYSLQLGHEGICLSTPTLTCVDTVPVGLVRQHVLFPFAFDSVVGLECAKLMIWTYGHLTGAGVVPKAGPKVTKVNARDHVVVAYTSCGKFKLWRKGETVSLVPVQLWRLPNRRLQIKTHPRS